MDTKRDREICEKATPGPWVDFPDGPFIGEIRGVNGENFTLITTMGPDCLDDDNLKFIAFARTALPEYITAYEAEKTAHEKAEVGAAVMREALEKVSFMGRECVLQMHGPPKMRLTKIGEIAEQALSSTAGQDMLDRMRADKEEIERLRTALEKIAFTSSIPGAGGTQLDHAERWLEKADIARTALGVEKGDD